MTTTTKETTTISTRDLSAALCSLEDVLVNNTATVQRLLLLREQHSQRGEEAVKSPTSLLKQLDEGETSLAVRRDRVTVEVRLIFLKVGEIDTQREQFNADVFIQFRWREPRLDGLAYEDYKSVDVKRLWNPELFVENSLGTPEESVWSHIGVDDNNATYVYERRRLKGCFAETLELADFPFDVQDLTVTLSSRRPDTELELIQDKDEVSAVNPSMTDQQEWRLYKHVETTARVTLSEYASSKQNYPCFSVTCRAKRNPGYFYWNVFFIMFLISSLSFCTFSVKHSLPQFRLNLAFTLVLTSVAFKFVIIQSLPRISYLTYLDKYVLGSVVILVIVCIWHCVITLSVFEDADYAAAVEVYAFKTFGGAYGGFHLCFGLWLYFNPCQRRRMMKRHDKELFREEIGPMKLDMLELYSMMEDDNVIKR